MQNRYVGDVGDFANNGLLRWLTGMTSDDDFGELSLGVVQYLNHDDSQFGNRVQYPELEECDPPLYEVLQNLVNSANRNVRATEYQELLRPNTAYFNECRCDFASRQEWLHHAAQMVKDSELLFLNPDNGIHDMAEAPDPDDSPKHLYLSDLGWLKDREHSLVIYQHQTRQNAYEFIQERIHDLETRLQRHVRVLWFHRRIARFYFIAIYPDHEEIVLPRLETFINGELPGWGMDRRPLFSTPHFTVIH